MKYQIFSIFSIIVALSSIFYGCRPDNDTFRKEEGMVWHTQYHITYRSSADLRDSIINTLSEVGASLNAFDPSSTVGRINAGSSDSIDADFRTVYEMSVKINGLTDGMFDPTAGPLITAWGFGKGHKATADTLRIDSLLKFVGIKRTYLQGERLVKNDPRTEFNFSAIAKGYGCDRVGEMLARNGVTDYLVEIGGEIRVSGNGPSGHGWRVSIDRPVEESGAISHQSQEIICLEKGGLATSGNYRNFHEGVTGRYGHTISPVTGRPVQTDVISASAVASTTMEADALATSFMALGSGRSKELADSLRLPVMLILSDTTVWMSEPFRELLAR